MASPPTESESARAAITIGPSVLIKGELSASEDLRIEGQVEGAIHAREHVLTIGPNARIKAQVFAKTVIVFGEVTGDLTATEKVDIRDDGAVDGDIVAPRLALAESAHFRGSVDMQPKGAQRAKAAAKPVAAAAPTPTPALAAQPATAVERPFGPGPSIRPGMAQGK